MKLRKDKWQPMPAASQVYSNMAWSILCDPAGVVDGCCSCFYKPCIPSGYEKYRN
jgi:hypothetical protein